MKAIVVYYSMSGNMKQVAESVASKLSADVLALHPVKAFPDKGAKKFLWGGRSAVMGSKPKLQPYIFNGKKYDTVIFVRYTLAVSYLKKSLSVPVYKLVCFALPVSEYFFYLDVSPEALMERVEKRKDKEEIFENYEDFVKVRAKAEPVLYNWHVIPADDSPEEIFSRIEAILDELDSKLLNETKKLE